MSFVLWSTIKKIVCYHTFAVVTSHYIALGNCSCHQKSWVLTGLKNENSSSLSLTCLSEGVSFSWEQIALPAKSFTPQFMGIPLKSILSAFSVMKIDDGLEYIDFRALLTSARAPGFFLITVFTTP